MQEIKLSSKDKDILFELSLNGRASLTELAKKVKLSKQVVSYRLAQMEKNKVIEGYHAITNAYMLGKTHYRVFLKYHNMSSEKETEFMDYLSRHNKVVWTAYFDGDLDAAFLVWAENIKEFEQVFDEICERYGKYFQEKHFSIATKIEYLRYRFLNEDKRDKRDNRYRNPKDEQKSIVFGDCYSSYALDKLDKEILSSLNENGRATLVELANKYKTSAKVIMYRMQKLMKNRIILGFNVKINHNMIGFTHRKVMLKLNNISAESIRKLSAYLRMHKSVIYIVKPIGEDDIEFELMTSTNEEFHDIMREIRSRFADIIKNYRTVIHYHEPKSGQSMSF